MYSILHFAVYIPWTPEVITKRYQGPFKINTYSVESGLLVYGKKFPNLTPYGFEPTNSGSDAKNSDHDSKQVYGSVVYYFVIGSFGRSWFIWGKKPPSSTQVNLHIIIPFFRSLCPEAARTADRDISIVGYP